jgi:hypothetical protein
MTPDAFYGLDEREQGEAIWNGTNIADREIMKIEYYFINLETCMWRFIITKRIM